jgi:hypothetical protein
MVLPGFLESTYPMKVRKRPVRTQALRGLGDPGPLDEKQRAQPKLAGLAQVWSIVHNEEI